MSHVQHICSQIESNDPSPAEAFLPLVYEELRKLAEAKLAHEKPGQTLNATALVHEAYLRLAGVKSFLDKTHFYCTAAEAMRRVLIDRARSKLRIRHGGGRERVPLSELEAAVDLPSVELIALDEALEQFSHREPAKADLVKLRFFAGLSEEEAAAVLGISRATASRYWTYSRAWLIKALDERPPISSPKP